MSSMNLTIEDLKELQKAQRDWDWYDFTKVTAREFMCQFIRNGYPNAYSEAEIAERSVRWVKALTEALRKDEELKD
jgi:hypothetical protein